MAEGDARKDKIGLITPKDDKNHLLLYFEPG